MAIVSERPRRIVLLGASNLTRGLSTAVETARRLAGGPLEVLAAFGHGRSYGTRKCLIIRELPGIIECGLWDDLTRRSRVPTAALVTDIGNDLLYGEHPDQIADWVGTCTARLRDAGATVVLTPLPMCSLVKVTPWRYRLLRNLLFPACGLSHETVMGHAHALDRRLRDLARQQGLHLIEHRPHWYGVDPIHIRRGCELRAWGEFYGPWQTNGVVAVAGSWARWFYLRRLAPQQRWLFGREFRRSQPAGRLSDGTTFAFY
jgi:hypothetical protein